MLNEDLIDPKDVKIAKLEHVIKKFKEYDAERKKHYASLEMEIGMLQSELSEVQDNYNNLLEQGPLFEIQKLKEKIKNQRHEITVLSRKILIGNYQDIDITDIPNVLSQSERKALVEKNRSLKEFCDRLLCYIHNPEQKEKLNQYIESLTISEPKDT